MSVAMPGGIPFAYSKKVTAKIDGPVNYIKGMTNLILMLQLEVIEFHNIDTYIILLVMNLYKTKCVLGYT